MRCAIYARKSTDDSDKTHDARSTTHQREQCLALIERQGWTLTEGHEYVDEATSGAVFNRPGLLRLMEALKAKPQPFEVLVMYAEDRPRQDAYGGRWFEFKAEGTFKRIVCGVIGFGEVESGRATMQGAHIAPADPIDAELAELVRAQERNADLPLGSGCVLSITGAPGPRSSRPRRGSAGEWRGREVRSRWRP